MRIRGIAAVASAVCLAVLVSGCVAVGDSVTEKRVVDGVEDIEMSGIGRLEIEQGTRESLTVTAPESIMDDIRTEMDGSTLVIDYDMSWWRGIFGLGDEDIVFSLVVADIDQVRLSGAANIVVTELDTESLGIDVSGASNVEIRDLMADELVCELSGAGNFDVAGEVVDQEVRLDGAGSYSADDLASQTARIRISGAGSATVWVERELDLELSGAGDLRYYGDPRVSQDISGAGRVQSLGER